MAEPIAGGSARIETGRTVEGGQATGRALLLAEPLSFWGGFDAQAGVIVATGHPDRGALLRGRVLLMERGKGSSSSSSVLAEAIRRATAPCAIVMREPDLIVALGAIVARELYGVAMPIVTVDEAAWQSLSTARSPITIDAPAGGRATLRYDMAF